MKISQHLASWTLTGGLLLAAGLLTAPVADAAPATGCQTFPDRNYCVYNAPNGAFVSISAFKGRVEAGKSDSGNTWLDSSAQNHVAAGRGQVQASSNASLKWRACAWFDQ